MEVLGAAIHRGSKDFHNERRKKRIRASPATPWDGMPAGSPMPAQEIVAASHRSMHAFRHERFDGDAAFFNGYPRSECPFCSGRVKRNGVNRAGIQRYRCRDCGRTSTPVTDTVFDNSKLSVTAWAGFLVQTFSFASTSLMTREDGRSGTTLSYWMTKLFAVLDGIQDSDELFGSAWIDETFVPDVAGRMWHMPSGEPPRGISSSKLCIGVGLDDSGKSVCFLEGRGRPTVGGTWGAFGRRIAPGSTLIHDKECFRAKLVRELGLESRSYGSVSLIGAPDGLNPIDPVDEMCFLLKAFLRSHSGLDRAD